jgi:hypothetical protein
MEKSLPTVNRLSAYSVPVEITRGNDDGDGQVNQDVSHLAGSVCRLCEG